MQYKNLTKAAVQVKKMRTNMAAIFAVFYYSCILQNTTVEYLSKSVYVSVCPCFCTITHRIIDLGT